MKTVISFKASAELEGKVDAHDPKVRLLIEQLAEMGFKFEGKSVYLMYENNGVSWGGTRIVTDDEIRGVK